MQSTVMMCIIGAFLGGGLGVIHTVSDTAPASLLVDKRASRELWTPAPDAPSSAAKPFHKDGRPAQPRIHPRINT